ncbi:MAG: transposase-like protein, partial [Planctomycetota bacterium]
DGLGLNSNLLSRWKRKFEEEGAVAFPGKGRQTEAEAAAHAAHRTPR